MIKTLLPEEKSPDQTKLKSILKNNFTEIKVESYTDVTNLLQLISENKPDIIFMNLDLVINNDPEAIKTLTSNQESKIIPVVALVNSQNSSDEKQLVFKESFNAFIHLPIDETEVKAIVRLLIQEIKCIDTISLLKESENKFHKLFSSSLIPQFSWNYDGKKFTLSAVNTAATKLTNNHAKDFVGLTADEIYSDRKDILERFYFCLEKRRDIVFETDYVVRRTKLKRRIIFTYNYVTDELLLLHTEDITERKHAEEQLIKSEKKYRSLITEMDQGLAVHEAVYNKIGKMTDYRFLEVNKSFEKLTGLVKEKVIGKTVLEALPNTETYWIEEYEKVVKTGKPLHYQNYSGELGKYFEVVAYRNQKDQFATVVTDITESKNSLKNLSLHNARLEALTKILKFDEDDTSKLLTFTLNQAVKITDSEIGFLMLYNPDLERFTMHAWSAEAEEKCGVDIKPVTYELEDTGCWAEAVRQRKPYIINDYSAPNKLKRGVPEGHVELQKFVTVPVIVDKEIKAVIGVANKKEDYGEVDAKQLTVITDALWTVVERKKHQQELIQAKEKAEESDRLKSAFLANMSHEIRTPMNGILGFAEMLKESELTSDQKGDFIEIIEKSGKRMLNTIDDLMDISRIESNLVEVEKTEVNVNEQIDLIEKFFQPEANSRGLQLEISKALPNEEAILQTDKDKFYAILMNLVKNALKYTKEGAIKLGYKPAKDTLLFYIEDTGIGIDKDKLESIFDRFVQADISLSKPYEGVGLGLSIAKAYVDLIGGKIWVESEKDKGSVFYLELPFEGKNNYTPSQPEKKQEQEKKVKHAASEESLFSNLTVLVAEDDEVGRVYLKQLLEGKCKKVFYAENGKKAVEIYAENEGIDLVLMDIKMPVMDGYSATIKIRSMDHNAVIIAQTAYALSGDREKAIAAGCDEYLTKPLGRESLISAIEKYFSKK